MGTDIKNRMSAPACPYRVTRISRKSRAGAERRSATEGLSVPEDRRASLCASQGRIRSAAGIRLGDIQPRHNLKMLEIEAVKAGVPAESCCGDKTIGNVEA